MDELSLSGFRGEGRVVYGGKGAKVEGFEPEANVRFRLVREHQINDIAFAHQELDAYPGRIGLFDEGGKRSEEPPFGIGPFVGYKIPKGVKIVGVVSGVQNADRGQRGSAWIFALGKLDFFDDAFGLTDHPGPQLGITVGRGRFPAGRGSGERREQGRGMGGLGDAFRKGLAVDGCRRGESKEEKGREDGFVDLHRKWI